MPRPSTRTATSTSPTAARFTVVIDGRLVEHQVPASQARELTALLGLRDTASALLAAEAATVEDTDRASPSCGAQLNTRYDAYVGTVRPDQPDHATAAPAASTRTPAKPRLARISPRHRAGSDSDPHSPAVYALEDFDADRPAPPARPRIMPGASSPPAPPGWAPTPPPTRWRSAWTPTARST